MVLNSKSYTTLLSSS